jgi:ribosomal protein S18 acetylase RimI-like enzyme
LGLEYAFLSRDRFPQIHRTFREAFADYYVDTSGVTKELLYNRAVKNGVDFESTVGAFDGDRMVAVTIVGVDEWKGQACAYDIGTGVIPAYRGRGVARRMFDFVAPVLRDRGVRTFVLEVIQENEPAIKAYRAAGFEVTREFDCFRWSLDRVRLESRPRIPLEIRPVERDGLEEFAGHLDWQPSWENSFSSIRRIPDSLKLYGAFTGNRFARCVGLLVYYPLLNWITTLVVKTDLRRNGVATSLLSHFARRPPGGVQIVNLVNVDHSDAGMLSLLEKSGFEPYVRQFEMECEL